jgi:PIN domain nuclease of toxin-antitoxin system
MKKYLLDTHVVLWVAENSPMLSEHAKNAILDVNTEKYVSIASAWEVAIKLETKELRLDGGLSEFYRIIDENGFYMLMVKREYLLGLPVLQDYHKDPFDRLLLATALMENMTIITVDENMHKYGISFLW